MPGKKQNKITAEELRLHRWRLLSFARELLPGERVSKCYYVRRESIVKINYAPSVRRAHYGGLVTCGSPWACPVCSSKISERRKVELSAIGSDWDQFMVTFTLRHNSQDNLKDLIRDLNNAFRKIKSGRQWIRFEQEFRIFGSVSGSEVTFGLVNGWHPHKHVLFFSGLRITKKHLARIKFDLTFLYSQALRSLGRDISWEIGVDVKSGSDVMAEYVTKISKSSDWSLISEVTKSNVKLARDGHYSPFELLSLYAGGDLLAGQKFVEYARALKGKNQLVYSRGLKKMLKKIYNLDVQTDQAIADNSLIPADLLAVLSADHWRIILAKNIRGVVLEVASLNDMVKLRSYLSVYGIDLE